MPTKNMAKRLNGHHYCTLWVASKLNNRIGNENCC